jgi:hypothetical protein
MAFYYGRGTPVLTAGPSRDLVFAFQSYKAFAWTLTGVPHLLPGHLQGYLTYQKSQPPGTLQ